MQKILNWFKNNVDLIKSNVVCLLLSFSILFIAGKTVESIFIQGQFLNFFGLGSLDIQMKFCLHVTVILFSFLALLLGFLIDWFILRKDFPLSARKIFWLFLLLAIVVKIIGHYKSLNAAGSLYANIFREIKYLICY